MIFCNTNLMFYHDSWWALGTSSLVNGVTASSESKNILISNIVVTLCLYILLLVCCSCIRTDQKDVTDQT